MNYNNKKSYFTIARHSERLDNPNGDLYCPSDINYLKNEWFNIKKMCLILL